MRYLIIFVSLLTWHHLNAQTLFELVKDNDIRGVKEYQGAINLRDVNQATPLMWAIFSADKKMVKLLIKKGADPESKGWIIENDSLLNYQFIYGSCVAVAAGRDKTDLLKYLVRKKDIHVDDREINLNDNKENGWTALHWASLRGNKKAARFLLRKGADVNVVAQTNNNQTPLHLAISFEQSELVHLLINSGADYNKTDLYGTSPLGYAFEKQSRGIVKTLLLKGAEFDYKENKQIKEELYKVFGIRKIEEL